MRKKSWLTIAEVITAAGRTLVGAAVLTALTVPVVGCTVAEHVPHVLEQLGPQQHNAATVVIVLPAAASTTQAAACNQEEKR